MAKKLRSVALLRNNWPQGHCTIFVLILLLNACSISPAQMGPGEKSLRIKTGQQFVVTMETDWKSQTRWVVKNYDESKLNIISTSHYIWSGPEFSGGTPCKDFFTFSAKAPGETQVTFKLEKYWGSGNFKEEIKSIYIDK